MHVINPELNVLLLEDNSDDAHLVQQMLQSVFDPAPRIHWVRRLAECTATLRAGARFDWCLLI